MGTREAADTLSLATEELRVLRATYRTTTVSAPGLFDGGEEPGLHLVERGEPTLRVDTRERRLGPGDLVLVPGAQKRSFQATRGPVGLLSGVLSWAVPDHPILKSLPRIIVVEATSLASSPRWDAHLASLRAEVAAPEAPGASTLLVRLTDVLLIEAMRRSPAPLGGAECPVHGFLHAAEDGILAPVLAAIHEDPGKPWTVALLADIAGQSRSAFAAHFVALMNETPMAYLARWRMFRARTLLHEGTLSMEAIAARVGYGSAAAFSLAFTREHGMSPGVFRRTARGGRPASSAS